MKIPSLIVLSALILTGCIQSETIDEITIIAGAAFDQTEDNKFRGTALVQQYLPDKAVENKLFTAEGKVRRDILSNIQKQAPGNTVTGGIEITIFGNKLADKGIVDFIDTFQRDPSIGARNFLVTAAENAHDILDGDYGPQGNAAYLREMIEHNIRQRDVPKTNFHIFLRDFYMEGRDPFLPELKKIGPDQVKISGLSIFKDDKETIILPEDKMFFFKLMVDKYSRGSLKVHLKKGIDANVESIKSTNSYKISKKGSDPSIVSLNIKIKGAVSEYTGNQITKKVLKKIAKKLEREVEKECWDLFKQFQEHKVDPVGFGNLHRQRLRHYNLKQNWPADYQNMIFKVNCNVVIAETGVIE